MSKISFYFSKDSFVIEATKKISRANSTLVFRNKMNSVLFPTNFTARDYDIFLQFVGMSNNRDMQKIKTI